MTLPTRDELLTLDWTYDGGPFFAITAKEGVSGDATYNGLPFFPIAFSGGGGEPEPDPELVPVYVWLDQSVPPVTSTTIARETGDVLLMEEGFTLIEETGSLDSGTPTIELFQTSTPTAGTWVLGRYYATNRKTDGVLRSPLPSLAGALEDATLTLVATGNTQVTFDWGIFGRWFGTNDPDSSDLLRFLIDDVEQMEWYPVDLGGSDMALAMGRYSFVVPAGTYELKWQWSRPPGTTWSPLESHTWITNLIIDPTF